MKSPLHGPAYRIETERLVLTCPDPTNAQKLIDAVLPSLEHLKPWMEWAEHDSFEFETVVARMRRFRGRFDLGQDYPYSILTPDGARILGGVGLHTNLGEGAFELGYWIHKDFINQGLATEVSAALTKVAFEVHHVNRVEIHCDPKNVRSAAVPRKLGYTYEATLSQRLHLADGTWRDTMIWTLLAQDYPQTPCADSEIKAFDVVGRRLL